MKHLKLFEDFDSETREDGSEFRLSSNNYGYTEPDISQEQRIVISNLIRTGILEASERTTSNLKKEFRVTVSTYEGLISEEEIEAREDGSGIFNQIADEIEDGQNFGIVESKPLNIEWSIECK